MKQTDIRCDLGVKLKSSIQGKAVIMPKQIYQRTLSGQIMEGSYVKPIGSHTKSTYRHSHTVGPLYKYIYIYIIFIFHQVASDSCDIKHHLPPFVSVFYKFAKT